MHSPAAKRVKLEPEASPPLDDTEHLDPVETEEAEGDHCIICLQPIVDRTVIPTCSHEFCFECILIWTDQSRRCPLCSQDVGKYLMHHIRSKYDYQKHFLAPLRTSSEPQAAAAARQNARQRALRRREAEWGRRRRQELEEVDELERAIEKRRWVYRHRLYAKHVASNPYTRYRPFPTPAQFAASQDYISRATIFIRRELRVWTGLDVEFLTTFTVSLMKSLDIRSEPAVRLLSEFLDMDADRGHERDNAEHFAHELYCYLRSPYRDLAAYDRNVQYDVPPDIPPPDARNHARRWQSQSRSRSPSGSHTRSLSCSRSPSPARPGAARSPSTLRAAADHRGEPTTSVHNTPQRHVNSIARTTIRSTQLLRDSHSDEQHQRSRSRSRERHSRRAGAPLSGEGLPVGHGSAPEPRNTRHQRESRYDGKGKGRADVRADRQEDASRAPHSREEEGMTSRGDVSAGIAGIPKMSPPSHACGQTDVGPSALSTPPRSADLSATITQNAGPSSVVSRVVPPITAADKPTPLNQAPPTSSSGRHPSASLKGSTEARPAARIRRNPWQTMQEYLSSGASGPRSSKQGDKAPGAELASETQSQAQQDAASNPRDGALRPGDPSPSDAGVPSLLLRLSDLTPPTSAARQHASAGVPDAAQVHLPVHERGKRISAPEIIAHVQAHLGKTSAAGDPSSDRARPQSTRRTGAGPQPDANRNAVGESDVGAVERMSSEDAAQARGAAEPARSGAQARPSAASADPRSALMRKLEAEKRDAAGIPTAEKAGVPPASVPMVFPDGSAGRPSKSAPGLVTAERIAERREAELRNQAQLRVRLAAAKRAAAAAAQQRIANTEGGAGHSTAAIDGDLAAQESALRGRLRARQTD